MATPSLALIPTGFKAGKLYSVLPEPIYGSELVTNVADRTFTSDTGFWSKTSGTTIDTVQEEVDYISVVGGGGLYKNSFLDASKEYLVSFEITKYTSGDIIGGYSFSGLGVKTFTISGTAQLPFLASHTFTGSITNVSVKEVIVGDGDFDVTRASTATRVNEQGLIESMANNVPRLDYTDGGCPVLLTEPQSTNIITYSEDFSNGSYVKSRIVVTSNNTTSPDGTINADKIIATAVSGTHFSKLRPTVTSGIPYTLSLFVKSAEYDWVTIMMQGAGWVGSSKQISFNSTTGVFGTVSTGITYSSQSLTNGWYKLSITNTTAATSANVRIYPTPSDSELSYTGDGTSGVYMYGAQLEALPYATSYIPTNGSTVTRVKDVVEQTGLSNIINSVEGYLMLNIAALSNNQTDRGFGFAKTGSGATHQIKIAYSTISQEIYGIYYDSGTIAKITYSSTDITQFNKVLFAYKENEFNLFVNGVKQTPVLSGSVSAANTFDTIINSNGGADYFYGKIKEVNTSKTFPTDAEAIILTTI